MCLLVFGLNFLHFEIKKEHTDKTNFRSFCTFRAFAWLLVALVSRFRKIYLYWSYLAFFYFVTEKANFIPNEFGPSQIQKFFIFYQLLKDRFQYYQMSRLVFRVDKKGILVNNDSRVTTKWYNQGLLKSYWNRIYPKGHSKKLELPIGDYKWRV